MCPIRLQTDTVDRIEILRVLSRHAERLGPAVATGPAVEPFPLHLNTPREISEVRQFESPELALLFEAFYDAARAGAAANSREEGVKYERPRLSQIGNAKTTQNQRAAFLEEWEKHKPSQVELENIYKIVPPELVEEMGDFFRDLALQFLDRTEEVGGANAYAEALGVDPTDRKTARSFTDQFSQQFAFSFSVREAARSLGIHDESLLEVACGLVRLDECPGTWLKYAVEIQMRKATAKDVPSNLLDLNHLGHLAYVDLLFTDKRVADFARRVMTAADLPPSLQGVRGPVSVGADVEMLESALFS
jgi:hypothetical protein